MEQEEKIKKELVIKKVERPWKDILEEILKSISDLSLTDRIRFRLACKRWKTMKLPPRSIPLPIDSKFYSQECPWFLYFHTSGNGACTYFHPTWNATYLTPISELADAIICHAKHGWLLMYHRQNYFFFFHPLEKVIITLPRPQSYRVDFSGITFSSPPTSPDCVVFAIYGFFKTDVEVRYCRHGEDYWNFKLYLNPVTFIASICNLVFYDGVLYCLGEDGKLGAFDPKRETWKVILKRGLNMSISMSFITECDAELISVFFGKVGIPVCVFKLDWNQMKWLKLEDLGNKMMYVSRATSLLLPAVTKGSENKIYLPRFREEGNVFYSICGGKYQIFDSDYLGENWYDTYEQIHCTWIDFNKNRVDFKTSSFSNQELDWLSNAPEDDLEDD